MLHSRLRALITTSLLLLPAALRADTLLDIYELAVKNAIQRVRALSANPEPALALERVWASSHKRR